MEKQAFDRRKLFGLFLICAGIALMIALKGGMSMAVAIFVSLLAGFTSVVSRMINQSCGAHQSALWHRVELHFRHHRFGGPAAALGWAAKPFSEGLPREFWICLGGGLGAIVVFLSNLTVTKVSALNLTLLMFVGQIFTSIVLDWLISGAFSLGNTLGGIFVAAGMGYNLWVDWDNSRKKAAQKAKIFPAGDEN